MSYKIYERVTRDLAKAKDAGSGTGVKGKVPKVKKIISGDEADDFSG